MDSNNIEHEVRDNDAALQRQVDADSRGINRDDRWEKLVLLALPAFLFYMGWGPRGLGIFAILAIVVVVWLLSKRVLWTLLALILGIIALIVYGLIAWQSL